MTCVHLRTFHGFQRRFAKNSGRTVEISHFVNIKSTYIFSTSLSVSSVCWFHLHATMSFWGKIEGLGIPSIMKPAKKGRVSSPSISSSTNQWLKPLSPWPYPHPHPPQPPGARLAHEVELPRLQPGGRRHEVQHVGEGAGAAPGGWPPGVTDGLLQPGFERKLRSFQTRSHWGRDIYPLVIFMVILLVIHSDLW